MEAHEKELAKASAGLTVADSHWLAARRNTSTCSFLVVVLTGAHGNCSIVRETSATP